jgi:Mg2+-importing ATPase
MLVVPTGAALIGAVLPYTGLAHLLGFTPLPTTFFLLLFGMVVVYLLLVEVAKTRFYRSPHARTPRIASTHTERLERRIRRRVSRFVHFVNPGARPGESGVVPPSKPAAGR